LFFSGICTRHSTAGKKLWDCHGGDIFLFFSPFGARFQSIRGRFRLFISEGHSVSHSLPPLPPLIRLSIVSLCLSLSLSASVSVSLYLSSLFAASASLYHPQTRIPSLCRSTKKKHHMDWVVLSLYISLPLSPFHAMLVCINCKLYTLSTQGWKGDRLTWVERGQSRHGKEHKATKKNT